MLAQAERQDEQIRDLLRGMTPKERARALIHVALRWGQRERGCLVCHAGRPVGCGLCQACHAASNRAIARGKTTAAAEIAAGRRRPSNRKGALK